MIASLVVALWPREGQQTSSTGPGSQPPRLTEAPAHLPVPEEPSRAGNVPEAEQIRTVMSMWRQAILVRDADGVTDCDRMFLDEPARFKPPLRESAEKDSDERVRAFSTRELGKMRDRTLSEFFRQRLHDPSPFVRENGAWALGELGATEATDDLVSLARQDPEPAVRAAADVALQRQRRERP